MAFCPRFISTNLRNYQQFCNAREGVRKECMQEGCVILKNRQEGRRRLQEMLNEKEMGIMGMLWSFEVADVWGG